jgi:hypothetical protein
MFLGAGTTWAIKELYTWMTPLGLGYVGAKHRDRTALMLYTVFSACAFLNLMANTRT